MTGAVSGELEGGEVLDARGTTETDDVVVCLEQPRTRRLGVARRRDRRDGDEPREVRLQLRHESRDGLRQRLGPRNTIERLLGYDNLLRAGSAVREASTLQA